MAATRLCPTPVAVAIMAKAPRTGTVKTRLCPPLAATDAADLYRAFLLDTVDRVRRLDGASPAIAFAPAEDRRFFEEAGRGFLLVPQQGPDLGARLANTFDRLFALGFRAGLVLGADTPTLPLAFLRLALALIGDPRTDVVLGPSEDGGYYLIGLRALHPALFEDMPWSTARVFEETVRRAEALELRVARLPSWYDVDTLDALTRLKATLGRGEGLTARHTRRFFAQHTRSPA